MNPGIWASMIPLRTSMSTLSEYNKLEQRFDNEKVVDIWHNAVTPVLWPLHWLLPPATPLRHPLLLFSPHLQKQSLSFIHRKGAAPVHYPSTSTPLPILPLPGSRATPTLILRPTLSSAIQHGALNALSLAHGAGRSMSRAKAASYMEGKYKGRESELLSGDIHKSKSKNHGNGSTVRPITNTMCVEEAAARQIHGGTYVICEDKALVWEEAGEAYKDVWDVGG